MQLQPSDSSTDVKATLTEKVVRKLSYNTNMAKKDFSLFIKTQLDYISKKSAIQGVSKKLKR